MIKWRPSVHLSNEQFSRIMLPNGTFKTTGRHRLDDLNEFCLPFIRALPRRPLRIMDVAASSGVTTEQWHQQLTADQIDCEIIPTDKSPYGFKRTIAPGVMALTDDNGEVIYFSVFGHGVSPRIKSLLAPLKIALRLLFALTPAKVNGAVQLSSTQVVKDDLLSPNPGNWVGAFDVIRAANILNLAYFDLPTIQCMLSTLRERLRNDGLLIVSRTREDNARNEASIFRGSEVIARLNGGSEITGLIQESGRL